MVKKPPRFGTALLTVATESRSHVCTSGREVQNEVISPLDTPLSSGCFSKKAWGRPRGSLR